MNFISMIRELDTKNPFNGLFRDGLTTKEKQGCIWAAPLGKWRIKITTGALFEKQCARHGALFSLRAHILKMSAPDSSLVHF